MSTSVSKIFVEVIASQIMPCEWTEDGFGGSDTENSNDFKDPKNRQGIGARSVVSIARRSEQDAARSGAPRKSEASDDSVEEYYGRVLDTPSKSSRNTGQPRRSRRADLEDDGQDNEIDGLDPHGYGKRTPTSTRKYADRPRTPSASSRELGLSTSTLSLISWFAGGPTISETDAAKIVRYPVKAKTTSTRSGHSMGDSGVKGRYAMIRPNQRR